MSRQQPKKCCQEQQLEEQTQFLNHHFLQCAELVLPWLTPQELAAISSTCKTFRQYSKSVTLRRSLDASRSFETFPVPFYNLVDQHAYAYFVYTPSQFIPSSSSSPQRQSWGSKLDPSLINDPVAEMGPEGNKVSLVDEKGENEYGCDCERCEKVSDENVFGCPCMDSEGLEIVNECGPSCGCGLECVNRLTQRGILVKLKVVRDLRKGWGLYAAQSTQEGQFVCEYAGELLTTEDARKRQQIYDQLASAGQFSSALLVVREHLPSGKACLRVNIDATRVGNVARFINHSCDGGNLSTILVRSSGALVPRLCFFASKDIREDEELTFSYGETRVRSNGLKCFCGSSCCFGTLPSEHT
ncbi:hypothetical protein SLE2022_055320 [Rubroshorea leprosula]